MNTFSKVLTGTLLALSIQSAFAGEVEHNTQAFLDVLNAGTGKPMEQLTPKDARAVLTGAQSGVKLTLPKADVSEKTIQVDGQPLSLTIVRPAGSRASFRCSCSSTAVAGCWGISRPTNVWCGIWWSVGGCGGVRQLHPFAGSALPDSDRPGLRRDQMGGRTRQRDQRRRQASGGGGQQRRWQHGRSRRLDGQRQRHPAIKFQVLLWPVTDANFDTGSYNQYAEGHFLTRNMMKWFWDNYTTDTNQRNEIYASPLRATTAQLKGLPPALVQTAEADVLRDEGEAYARKLDEAGVPVTSVRYNGMIHDYGLLNVVSQVPAVRSAMLQASEELKQHLKK